MWLNSQQNLKKKLVNTKIPSCAILILVVLPDDYAQNLKQTSIKNETLIFIADPKT